MTTAAATKKRRKRKPAAKRKAKPIEVDARLYRLVEYARPKHKQTMQEFAEKNVRLPRTSPYGNVPFSCTRQPYTRLLFAEMDKDKWQTQVITGPSQSGKTLSAFVIPTLRDAVGLRLNTIVGFPEADMASDKWDTDFKPTMLDSPELSWLLPTSGPGSKGGRIRDRVSLRNGVDLKIITRGGDDTAKAGYTSPRVRVTEAAGWSHAAASSVEANPLRQLRARMKGFKRNDKRRCLSIEGTLTVEDELPWSLRGSAEDGRLISSCSRILSPCPHCREWIAPDREHLIGWQTAQSEDEAANEARFSCPECGGAIDNDQRRAAVEASVLVHHGQSVNKKGDVVGDMPPTSTLFFHWRAWDNLLRDAADFAVAEWEAQQIEEGTEERENAERELCQFDFSKTFKSTLVDENEPLEARKIRKRCDTWKRNVLPADTIKLTVGIDLGDWTAWAFVIAHRAGGQKHVVSYSAFDVKRDKSDDVESRIIAALHDYADNVLEQGFPQEGTDGHYIPDCVWIDGGYKPDAVARFIRERGGIKQRRYWLARGRGKSQQSTRFRQIAKLTSKFPKIGKQWYAEANHKRRILEITFNADHWKLNLDERLRAEVGKKGALTFCAAEVRNEHAKVSNHLANEQYVRKWEPGKGIVEQWNKTGDNHYKDAAAMALAAGDMAGVDLIDVPDDETDTASETATKESKADNFYAAL